MIFYHIDIKNKKYYFNIFSNKKLLKNNCYYIPPTRNHDCLEMLISPN